MLVRVIEDATYLGVAYRAGLTDVPEYIGQAMLAAEFAALPPKIVPAPAAGRLVRSAWGACGGAGVLHGTAAESGTWHVVGPGQDDTFRQPGGYATSEENAYCFLQAGAPVCKAESVFQGPDCTLAIALDDTLADMVHVNFAPGDQPFVMYWKTGVGASQIPTFDQAVAPIPVTGRPMKFAIELVGDFLYCYAEDQLCHVAYDANFATLKGAWAFSQLHGEGAPDRLYSLVTYVGA